MTDREQAAGNDTLPQAREQQASGQSETVTQRAPRRFDLDRLKVAMIVIVVLGHVVARDPPPGAEWFWVVKDAIYQFHMAVFMFISGFLFFKSGYHSSPQRYGGMVRGRAERLLIPFLLMGLLVVCGKYFAGKFVHVDNFDGQLWPNLINIFNITGPSAVSFIWYLFVLFLYSVFCPPLLRLCRSYIGLFVLSLPLMLLGDVIHVLFLEYAFKLLPFFVLGGMAQAHQSRYYAWLERGGLWFALPFVIALLAYVLLLSGQANAKYKVQGLLTAGLTAIPFFHAMVNNGPLSRSKIMLATAPYVFSIYLFNVLFIGLGKAILSKFVPWDATWFAAYLVALLGAGILGPILLKRLLLARIPIVDKFTS